MRRFATAAVVLLSVTLLVAACSDKKDSGTSQPPTASPSSATALPFGGAPSVPRPLPASVLAGDPCTDALTPAQVKTNIGVQDPGKHDDVVALGPFCSWFNPNTLATISVGYDTQTHTGLSGVYQNTQPQTKTWKVLPDVQGFPTVAHDFTAGNCQISVGLADDLTIYVSGSLGRGKQGTVDPCDATAATVGDVITTLKDKAGA
jgi:hypothetical protein